MRTTAIVVHGSSLVSAQRRIAHAMDEDSECLNLILENADFVHPAFADRLSGASPFSPIYNGPVLWLGNRKVAEDSAALRFMRISHVVNCAASQVSSPLLDAADG